MNNFESTNAVIVSGEALLKISSNDLIKEHFVELTDYA